MESSSSGDEDFEGFVVSPEEKASYRAWTRKRRASDAFNSNSDDELSGDDDYMSGDDEDDDEDEDEDDDESAIEEEQDEENENLDDPTDDINMQDPGDEMSSGNTDQCPVCLMSLKEQLLGTPNNCPHVFCFECIQEWAKNATTCPVGRKPFSEILVHATKKGPILQRIPVEERQVGQDEEEDDPTYCEVCGEYTREDRMLLCDECDRGYHMDCLSPPVEFVPLDEWFCPACSSHEELQAGESEDEQLREETCARTTHETTRETTLESTSEAPRGVTRGRPRESTAGRVSGLGRTATTRTARTVASTRGRGRTGRGRRRGRGRGRSSSRGRGRGGSRKSTIGRSSSKKSKTGMKKKRKLKGTRRTKKTGASTAKKRRKTSTKKTLKPTKRRRVYIPEEDEVSPFIYEPKRRGRTVHARLLESLSSTGPTTEPGRSTAIGKMPFPSKVEASCSFSLFGNAYALYDFDGEEDAQETTQKKDEATVMSSESTNPDVLGSIFQGLDTLHSPGAQLSRDGEIVAMTDRSYGQGYAGANASGSEDNSTIFKENDKSKCGVEMYEKTTLEKNSVKERSIDSKERDHSKVPSKDLKRNGGEYSAHENIFENISSSKAQCTASSNKPAEKRRPQNASSSSVKSVHSSPSKCPSSKSTLAGFRIPKRSSSLDSQNDPSQMTPTCSTASVNVKRERIPNSSISKFKIPKRSNSTPCYESSKQESSSVIAKPTDTQRCLGQKLATSLTSAVEQNLVLSNFTSPSKDLPHYSSGTKSQSARSSISCSNSVRPIMLENLQRRNSLNLSATATEPRVTNSSSEAGCHAHKIRSISHSNTAVPSTSSSKVSAGADASCVTTTSNVTRSHTTKVVALSPAIATSNSTSTSSDTLSVRNSNNVTTCHTKKLSDIPYSHATTSNSVTPLSKVAPLLDNLQPVGVKEQRRSNIEIIKMLHKKKRSMKEQMSDNSKALAPCRSLPSRSDKTDSRLLWKEGLHRLDKSPSCSRGVNLPVAIVKPSPQMSSAAITMPITLPCSSSEKSPVKSIASGIIDAHSCNTQEFKRVRSESNTRNASGTHVTEKKQDDKVAQGSGDRDQQRKLGIVRLQRQQQIVDEVKLALKPFFRRGEITKDDYKLIMRKSVEKIKESSSSVDRDRVGRLVKKYIQKVKGVNFSSSP